MGSDKTNPMMLTDKLREELKAFLTASIEKRCTVYPIAKQRQLEALRDNIALQALGDKPTAAIAIPDVPEGELVYSTAYDTFGEDGCMMITKYELDKFIAEIKRINCSGVASEKG